VLVAGGPEWEEEKKAPADGEVGEKPI